MKVKIKNKVEQKITEYQKQTGATKAWICKQLGISQQRLYQICIAENIMLDVAVKISIFLKCDVMDLFDYEIIDEN